MPKGQDSMADGQDETERVNGLMSAMNKKEAENAALRERLAGFEAQGGSQAQEPDDGNVATVDSQPDEPEYEDGAAYRWDAVSRAMVDFTPTPGRPNGPPNNEPPTAPASDWDYSPSGKGFPV